jgi:TolB-like protein
LYFVNLSPDTSDKHLADGLTEQLTERLAQLERLNVRPSTAVRRHQRDGSDLLTTAHALRVSYVVSGTVFPRPNGLRVTVELFKAAAGTRVWSASYDRSAGDVVAIEQDIAHEIATDIVGQLRPAERATIAVFPTRNREAYDHFLRGLYVQASRGTPDLLRALRELEAAVRIDTTFARAHARIGLVYGFLLLPGNRDRSGVSAESLIARGLAATDRALNLDPTLSDAWVSRGRLLAAQYSPLYPGVLTAYERAIALDERNAEALNYYGTWMLLHRADLARARAAFERALALDPEHGSALGNMAIVEFVARNFVGAQRWLDSGLAVTRGRSAMFVNRAMVRLASGDTAGARSDARAGSATVPLAWAVGIIGLLDLRQGDTTAARRALDDLLARPGDPDRDRGLAVSALFVALGEPSRAIDYLERVRPRQGSGFPLVLSYVFLDPIRSDPRFQKLVEESRPR